MLLEKVLQVCRGHQAKRSFKESVMFGLMQNTKKLIINFISLIGIKSFVRDIRAGNAPKEDIVDLVIAMFQTSLRYHF